MMHAEIGPVRAELKQLAELAAKGRLDVRGLVERGEEIQWPTSQISAEVFTAGDGGRGFAKGQAINVLAIMCALNLQSFEQMIESEIDAVADDKAAFSNDERAKREHCFTAAILECEREECFWIEQAAASGASIPYRAETDVRAILGLADSVVAS